jgi:type IV pilus assembly protein PilO
MALQVGLDQIQARLDRFARLPKAYRVGAVAALCASMIGLYGYLLYRPAHAELARVEKKEQELQRKVGEVRAIIANLPAFEKEIEELEGRLRYALRQLPDSKELPVLLTDISSLGKDAGLEFKRFRPQPEISREFYAEVPIEIEFSGSYHEIARFFDKVSRLPRIVNVNRLEMAIADSNADSTRLSVKGEATTFRFIEHAAAPAAAEPQGAQPKKRGGPQRSAAVAPRGGRS